jgi:hypothetical protein
MTCLQYLTDLRTVLLPILYFHFTNPSLIISGAANAATTGKRPNTASPVTLIIKHWIWLRRVYSCTVCISSCNISWQRSRKCRCCCRCRRTFGKTFRPVSMLVQLGLVALLLIITWKRNLADISTCSWIPHFQELPGLEFTTLEGWIGLWSL